MTKNPQIPPPSATVKKDASRPGKPVGLPQTSDGEMYEENFTDVEGFPIASEGSHHAKIINFEKSESKGGNPQYVWQFRITAGDSKDIELRFWTSLLPQARWKAAETLDAIGIEATGSIARFHRGDIIGRPCIIEVVHDTFEGRLNHKVQRVHPPDEESVNCAKRGEDDVPF